MSEISEGTSRAQSFVDTARGTQIDGSVSSTELARMKARFIQDLEQLGGHWNGFYDQVTSLSRDAADFYHRVSAELPNEYWLRMMSSLEDPSSVKISYE